MGGGGGGGGGGGVGGVWSVFPGLCDQQGDSKDVFMVSE